MDQKKMTGQNEISVSAAKRPWTAPALTRIEMKRTLHFGGTGHDNKHQNDIPPGTPTL